MYTGSCLCGGVQFRISAELGPIELCYCRQCRKASGTAFASNASAPASAFHVTRGAELLSSFESSPGEERVFCVRCGSPIISRKNSAPEVVRVRVGSINEPLLVCPAAHYYVASKCNWWQIGDGLPQFMEEP
jgi:hypothetical protein